MAGIWETRGGINGGTSKGEYVCLDTQFLCHVASNVFTCITAIPVCLASKRKVLELNSSRVATLRQVREPT